MIRRTHDRDVYLRENRYEQPKEAFKRIGDLAEVSGVLAPGASVADFGCAAGEFLHYLGRRFPTCRLAGFDVVPDLLVKARECVPGVDFREGSVLYSDLLSAGSLDAAFMLGVMQIFDEFHTCLDNLLRWTRPGGRIWVFGLFNPHPVDVWVKYRRVDDPDRAHLEPGWNMFSRESVGRFLDGVLGAGRHAFTPFELPFDLAPNVDDVVRTWTLRDERGRRFFTNGLSLLCHLDILEIAP